jgi:hypothetical protein
VTAVTPTVLRLADAETLADLDTYLRRANRADPDGAARLIGHGDVLAVYVSPVHGGGGPDVLGLRTLLLGRPEPVDVTVPSAALVDALAGPAPGPDDALTLVLPADLAAPVVTATWAAVSPPRRGWRPAGAVPASVLVEASAAGIAEVTTGAGPGAGAAAVAALRARVWGRPLREDVPVPAGVAFAADVLGFVDPAADAAVYRSGSWWRVTTGVGHVLARSRSLLG